MDADEAEDALIDNELVIPSSTHTLDPTIANSPFADRVISMSNLKEATEIPPTSKPSTSTYISEVQTFVLLLKIISVLLLLIFISNAYFNFSNRPTPIPAISSGPSPSTVEELAELRSLVSSLETKFNSFITGAKKEL